MIDTLPIGYNNYSRFWAPWVEELVKGLAVVLLFRLNRIGYKLEARTSPPNPYPHDYRTATLSRFLRDLQQYR